jgi:hypothetical protein
MPEYARDVAGRWQIEFYETPDGRLPVEEWLESLSRTKRRAAAAGLDMILAVDGPAVCASPWGKHLGRGLFEFRLRHGEREIRNIRGERPISAVGKAKPSEKVVLRFFCHACGDRVVVLLGAYDKGRDPSPKRQRQEIEEARKRLPELKARK